MTIETIETIERRPAMATTPSAEAPPTDAAKVAAICAAVLGLVLAIAALAVLGMRAGVSVAIGAAIAVANLVMMSAIVRAVLRPAEAEAEAMADANVKANAEAKADADAEASANGDEEADAVDHAAEGRRGAAAWGAFGLLKIVVLFGGIYVLLTKGLVDPMPLVVGYGVLPLGIAASSLFSGLAPRSRRAGRPRPRTK
jgi:hypothetical protein